MKDYMGVWLPDWEVHLIDMMRPGAKRHELLPDGRPTYQRHKYRAALEFVKNRDVFVDVGGHCALWGMQAEQDFANIHAFEPNPEFAEIYPHNMRTHNWCLHRVALGDREDTVSLGFEKGSSGGTYVVEGDGNIPMRTLDSFEIEHCDLMKIDVEGYELPVVMGARDTIRRTKPVIVIEQKGRDARNFKAPPHRALAYLTKLGMKPLRQPISGDHFMGW